MRLMALAASGLIFFIGVSYILHEQAISIKAPINPMGAGISAVAGVEQNQSQPEAPAQSNAITHAQPPAQAPGAEGSTGAIPLPDALQRVPWAGPEQLVLWQNPSHPNVEVHEGIEHIIVQIDPTHLTSLHPGQTLIMPLPDGAPEVHAVITETFNDAVGTHNWKTQVQNELPNASVLITQGDLQTHIAVFTEAGSYTLIADNKTGRATLVDEGKLIARQAQFDDGVVLQEHPTSLPPITP